MSFSASRRLPKSAFTMIIVKEFMCYLCLRTPVTHVSGLYKNGNGEKGLGWGRDWGYSINALIASINFARRAQPLGGQAVERRIHDILDIHRRRHTGVDVYQPGEPSPAWRWPLPACAWLRRGQWDRNPGSASSISRVSHRAWSLPWPRRLRSPP